MRCKAQNQISEILTWIALFLALSPILFDLSEHLVANAWACYILVFLVLLLRCIFIVHGQTDRHESGYILIILALGLSIFGAIGGKEFLRFARISIPFGIIGLAMVFGRPLLKVALLSLWLVPIPTMFLRLFSPTVEVAFLHSAVSVSSHILSLTGIHGAVLNTPTGDLAVTSTESGLVLLALLSGLGWYSALLSGLDVKGCIRRAFCYSIIGIPLQWLSIVIAVLIAKFGHPATAKLFLVPFLLLWVSLGVIIFIECKQRRTRT